MKKKCTQCSSEELLEGLRVADLGENNRTYDLQIQMDTRPGAILMKGTASATIKATMCCICGNVMLFAPASFAANLKQFQQLRKESGKLGDPTQHPRYQQFLKSDPANKYLEPADQVTAFAEWMRKHGSDAK